MDGFKKLRTADIATLRACDLAEYGQGIISLEDPENFTNEHLLKIRELHNEAQLLPQLDVGLLDNKLKALAGDGIPPTGDTTPEPLGDEEFWQERLPDEKEAYNELIELGGCPTHDPETLGLLLIQEPERRTGIFKYWFTKSSQGFFIMLEQRDHWTDFQQWQENVRKRYSKSNSFPKYVQKVNNYRSSKGLTDPINLCEDRHAQSNLDDWKELHYRELVKQDSLCAETRKAAEKLREAESHQSGQPVPGPDSDSPRLVQYRIDRAENEHMWALSDETNHAILLSWIAERVQLKSGSANTDIETSQEVEPSIDKNETADDADAAPHQPVRKRPRVDDLETQPERPAKKRQRGSKMNSTSEQTVQKRQEGEDPEPPHKQSSRKRKRADDAETPSENPVPKRKRETKVNTPVDDKHGPTDKKPRTQTSRKSESDTGNNKSDSAAKSKKGSNVQTGKLRRSARLAALARNHR